MLISSDLGLSPSLWRAQYGRWTDAETNPLEGTAVLLAEHINRMSDDCDFATRMVTDALTGADKE
ncbi:hypothetical protein ACFZC3_30410 [Streptomyces sp. NPDC007903]|uniref:hypothetical protein n=1 Tax=Streptomyces sp. NPDC007903 TaxID=3364786 RepID=UPI0036EF69D5